MKMIETVNILDWKYGYFPRRFLWRGSRFEVVQVDRVESRRREWPRRQQSRHYWVRTDSGAFVLQHDLLHGIWRIIKAPADAQQVERADAGELLSHTRRPADGYRLVVVR
jgi:hypothetical protein